jgi:hypothetical protein
MVACTNIRFVRALLGAVLLASLMLLTHDAGADEGPMSFHSPEGWSEGHDVATTNELVRDLLGTYDVAYLAIAPGDRGRMFAEYLPTDETAPVDAAYLDRVTAHQLLNKRAQVARAIDRTEIVDVDGVPWGRVEATVRENVRLIMWVVPGRPRNALILFVVPSDALERLRPALDAVARATRGAASPQAPTDSRPLGFTMAGVIAALILWGWRRRKRLRRTAGAT